MCQELVGLPAAGHPKARASFEGRTGKFKNTKIFWKKNQKNMCVYIHMQIIARE